MSRTQVAAAAILLRKVVPDVAAIEHTGKDGQPLELKLVVYHDSIQLQSEALPTPGFAALRLGDQTGSSGLAS